MTSIYDDGLLDAFVEQDNSGDREPRSDFVKALLPQFRDGERFIVTCSMANTYRKADAAPISTESALRTWVKSQLNTKAMTKRGVEFTIVAGGRTKDGQVAVQIVGERA